MKLVFASNNAHKIQEIKKLLPQSIEIVSLIDIGCHEDIAETATTIEGNASIKANYIYTNYGYNAFADDSGLEIDALDGAPGVYSARFAGEQRSDSDNINKVLHLLEGTPHRKANFKTVIALNIEGKETLFTGIVNGEITTSPKGDNGFGYDPIFIAEGNNKTFAEISSEEKNAISHRAKAVAQLIDYLKELK